jgi:hypothetical protein
MKDRSVGDERGRTMVDVLGLTLAAITLCASIAWAADPVTVSSLQTYPEAYKMKVIQIVGTVSGYHMDHFIGSNSKLEKCVQNFLVDDGTGSIQASYAALCNMGPVMLRNGDQVTIEAYYLGTLDVKSVKKN